ncbi:hypothetical protein [Marinobacter sp. PE14]
MIRVAKRLLTISVITLLVGGCTVIHFDNGERPAENAKKFTQWHHSFVFETIEGSNFIDPAESCKSSEWRSVKIEHAYSSVIATSLLWESAGASALVSGLWMPRAINIYCID